MYKKKTAITKIKYTEDGVERTEKSEKKNIKHSTQYDFISGYSRGMVCNRHDFFYAFLEFSFLSVCVCVYFKSYEGIVRGKKEGLV